MNDWQHYTSIMTYVDQFHKDIGALVALIEQLMLDRGYVSLPSAGNRASWGMSSHIERPDAWRVPNLSRLFMPEDSHTFSQTPFYFINLETGTAFDFPPVICGRLIHPPLTENEVYMGAYNTGGLKTLAHRKPSWRYVVVEKGWTVMEPAFKCRATQARVFLLNLFDLRNKETVLENIIIPLTDEVDLDEILTIPRHPIPGTGGA
ncbi:MAG: hypothetical protein GX579_08820 [Chloroflexi bacterium]|mgnify:CR=1 FL=1|jgi:hypothetical protein|nr:hypothetical protein [Chloroflexota bacterium]